MELINKIIKAYPLVWPRLYAYLRTSILPIKTLDKYVPEGRILDVGCGYGITSIYFALKNSKREVIGSELSKERVKIANKISKAIPNVNFESKNLIGKENAQTNFGILKNNLFNGFDAIVAIDLLHHINNKEKQEFIKECKNRLNKKGVLIIKDIDKKPLHKYLWNYLHDLLMTRDRLYFYSAKQLKKLLETNGFKILKIRRLRSLCYPHVLFVCSF